jgi:hypothetical protein
MRCLSIYPMYCMQNNVSHKKKEKIKFLNDIGKKNISSLAHVP